MPSNDILNGQTIDVVAGDYVLPIMPGSSATIQIISTTGLKFTLHCSNNKTDVSPQVPGGYNGAGYPSGTVYGTDTGALAAGGIVDAVPGNVVFLIIRVTEGTGRICAGVGQGLKVLS